MAAKKNYYYILMMTNSGPVFVTDIKPNQYAEWSKDKAPKEFDKARAEDITMGLNLNFNLAFTVCSKFPLETQPYMYNIGDFKWVEKKTKSKKGKKASDDL